MSIWKDMALWDTKDVPMCFGCGRDNTIGLKLDFHQEGESVRAEFIPGELYQGWPGVVHGGLICTMLDEVIGYAAGYQGLYAVTVKMEVCYRKPAMIGQRLLLCAGVKSVSGRTVVCDGEIRLEDGTLIAEAHSELRIIRTD
ncbi:MAG TPA: PaaI family thioesterase [Dehalococcoidia bacterium]|nr:PaaI family thioesterase [Dehalococcoidia bacterium]